MSQAGSISAGGSGGSGITTINGDTGSITGSTVTIFAHNSTQNAGSTVKFVNSGTVSTLDVTDANNNTMIGLAAGGGSSSGSTFNVGIGRSALNALTTGSANTAVGYGCASDLTTGSENCCYGNVAAESLLTGSQNVIIGYSSGSHYTSSESNNIIISNTGVVSESNKIRIGSQGSGTGQQNECFIAGITGATPTSANTPQVVLCDSGGNLTTISSSTSGFVLTSNGTATPTFQAAGGGGSVSSVTGTANEITASPTTGAVVVSLPSTVDAPGSVTAATFLTATSGNITATAGNLVIPNTNAGATQGAITMGGSVAFSNFGTDNFFAGPVSGNTTLTGSNNTGIGANNSVSLTTGSNLTALGFNALASCTTGNTSVAIGEGALQNDANPTNNVAIGFEAMQNSSSSLQNNAVGYQALQECTGSQNNAFGFASLAGLTTGFQNTCIGHSSGADYTSSEDNNICIGYNVRGTTGESNVTRIGNGSGVNTLQCFIGGVSGVTVTGTAVLCSTSGQLGTISSSIRYKENVAPIADDVSILHLKPVEFNYKKDEGQKKHYGLIAEDVDKDFPYLCFYNDNGLPESVKYHELPVFLLKEIQRLNDRIVKLEEKISKDS